MLLRKLVEVLQNILNPQENDTKIQPCGEAAKARLTLQVAQRAMCGQMLKAHSNLGNFATSSREVMYFKHVCVRPVRLDHRPNPQ